MKIPIYQIDAFTDNVFGGNPAAVCTLDTWLEDDAMQKIAEENAVSETAFIIPNDDGYDIRWFTPDIEMDLCGHATLAAAHVIATYIQSGITIIKFYSKSGLLTVTIDGKAYTLDLPSRMPLETKVPQVILDAFSQAPIAMLKARDYVLVFESEEVIRDLQPNQKVLDQINLDPGGVIITAKGNEVDFVSRFFTPQSTIFEDPVTGSAHCSLIPYWANQLNKTHMQALQLSQRGGNLMCENKQNRVLISGDAVTYMQGEIFI